MPQILKLNEISPVADKEFPAGYTFAKEAANPDGIMLRSFNMHEYPLNDELLAVARAGAGTNNIPIPACTAKGIVVFNTPGANANAVKELVICELFLGGRKITDAIDWVKTLKGTEGVGKTVEKGKSKFVGHEISGKTLGVIGLGAIGVMVANTAVCTSITGSGRQALTRSSRRPISSPYTFRSRPTPKRCSIRTLSRK